MKISALIIARNEENVIENTLSLFLLPMKLLLSLIDQLIKTKSICRKYTNKIFTGFWTCEGQRRNYGIKKCTSEWILEIDADEIVSKI